MEEAKDPKKEKLDKKHQKDSAKKVENTAAQAETPKEPENLIKEAAIPQPKPKTGKKILIVEDEVAITRALALKLQFAGYEVSIAYSGVEGIEQLKKQKFDLILLDLVMPAMDGFVFLSTLKQNKIPTPVVVLTNLGQNEDVEKAKQLGAVDYFVKASMPLSKLVSYITSKF